MKTRSGVFAVAITVLLLMALTLNVVSAGPPAKGSITPVKQAVEQNPSEPYSPEPYSHGPYKVKLNPSEPMAFPTDRVLNPIGYGSTVVYNAYAMYEAYNGFAVQFTPLSYPVEIITARFCFYPDCPHEQFAVYVYDDDGPDGRPNTPLGGPIYHTATEWGWCSVDLSELDITIADGDFYILYQQLVEGPEFEGDPFTCEGLCYNLTTTCANRSWDYILDEWENVLVETEKEEDYMIRCVVNDSTVESAAWTFMVYLDGDNNLEGAGIDDFMEMSSVNANSDVNIVVQFDRIPDYDSRYGNWTTCKRFHVTAGQTPTAANATNDLGECNMGDPDTLESFVTWAKTYFPADNYALILWNRGSGWKKRASWAGDETRDDTTGIGRGVCYDDTSGDYLTLQETGDALTGRSVQLLGYDAGFMHMVEVVYQVKANVEISVGSEDSALGSWPYDTILANLTATPTMTPRALGTVIVQRYMESYGYGGRVTQSAVDNSDFSDLVTAIDELAGALITEINAGHVDQVQQARSDTVQIHYEYYIDLYNFAQKVQTHVPGAATQAQAVMDSVDVAVYAEEHGLVVPNEHGLSIYYPLEEGEYLASYDGTAFAGDTDWDEFLMFYYNGAPPPPPGDDIAVFRDGVWHVDTTGNYVADLIFGYGLPCDVPLVGDTNHDETDDIVVIRDCLWYVDTNKDHEADMWFHYGLAGDDFLIGDFNQDGTDDIAAIRDCLWYVDTNKDHVADMWFHYGLAGDDFLVGDINQDGTDDIAAIRDCLWYVDTNNDHEADMRFNYGLAGDDFLVGDINRDGTDDIAAIRDCLWYVDTNGDHIPDMWFYYGLLGDIFMVGCIG